MTEQTTKASTERGRVWKAANAEHRRQYEKEYRRKNSARIQKRDKESYEKQPEKAIQRTAEWRTKNNDRLRDTTYKRLYGITLEQYEKMLDMQGGVCALCKQPPKKMRLSVDHCHRDKRVRGLACFRCNKFLIGRWKSEHAPLLRAASEYLESKFDGRSI